MANSFPMMKMNIASISLIAIFLSLACSPRRVHLVLDKEQILSLAQFNKLDSLFLEHEKKTTNEIVLVTTNDYGKDSNIIDFAKNFGNKVGVGKKGKDNGVVIVYCRLRHEIRMGTGLGTQRVLTDKIAKKIIDSLMLPEFKNGEIFNGLWKGSTAIVSFLERPENKIQ